MNFWDFQGRLAAKAASDDEARDDHGRWTSDGGSGASDNPLARPGSGEARDEKTGEPIPYEKLNDEQKASYDRLGELSDREMDGEDLTDDIIEEEENARDVGLTDEHISEARGI